MTTLAAGAATDVGLVRANNQDQLLVAEPLFAVADGMGGHAAGEVASQTALDALALAAADAPGGRMSADDLVEAVRAANRAVWDASEANPDYRGMGTTLTGIALVRGQDGDEELAVVNVGDSRTYRLRAGRLEQVTVDHSLVAELVAEGQISEAEAEVHPQRHVLTRALGVYPDVEVDVLTTPVFNGDRYVLCSDGLSREVTDSGIASVLRRLADPSEAARELVAAAKAHGGSDNITVVVVDITGGGHPAPDPGGAGGDDTAAIPATSPVADDTDRAADDTDAAAGGAAAGEDPTRAVAVVVAAPVADPDGPAGRVRRHRRPDPPTARVPQARLVTGRVVGFFALLVLIIGVAFGGTAWYARSTYFVGLRDSRIVIFKGRPGGVLWWKPTVAENPGVALTAVDGYHDPALRAGVEETSLSAARSYVGALTREHAAAQAAPPSPSTTPAPTTPTPATTAPTTPTPATTAPGSPTPTSAAVGPPDAVPGGAAGAGRLS